MQRNSRKEYVAPCWLATIYAALGHKDSAFRLLENAFTERSNWILDLRVGPRFASLHADGRFQDLLAAQIFPSESIRLMIWRYLKGRCKSGQPGSPAIPDLYRKIHAPAETLESRRTSQTVKVLRNPGERRAGV